MVKGEKRVVDLICFASKPGINVGFIAAKLQLFNSEIKRKHIRPP